MTTQSISRFCGLLVSTLLTVNSFAQVSEFTNLQRFLTTGHNVKVYENIQTEFDKQFAGAQNIKWSKLHKNYLAEFFLNDQNHRVLLNQKADLIYHITYGKEKHLPVDIRRWVKRSYVEFTITSAIKVEEAGRTIWLINVEDETEFAWIRVENDDIEEVQKYTKSTPPLTPSSSIVKQ